MALRLFTADTAWDAARRDLRFTAAALAASDDHPKLAKPARDHLKRWKDIEAARIDAEDAIVDANAVVAFADVQLLDPAVQDLANELLHEAGQDRSHPVFSAFFPEAPNDIVRMGLATEIERTKKFFNVARERKVSKAVQAVLDRIAAAHKRGEAALRQREEATLAAARVSLQIQTWKEDANGIRRSIENALDRHANDARLTRAYAASFFPAPAPVKKKAKPAVEPKAAPAS